VISCCRAFEKVGDVALRHDDDGATKLQGVTLERTGHETRPKGRKTLGKGFHPDDIGKPAFKLQKFIGVPGGIGEQNAPVTCHVPEFFHILDTAITDHREVRPSLRKIILVPG